MVEILMAKKADLDAHEADTANPHSVTPAQASAVPTADRLSGSAALNFDLTSVDTEDLTIAVAGAVLGDKVALGVPNGSVTASTLFFAWVSAADVVTVRAMRIAGTPNPASGTFKVDVWKN